MESDDNPRDGRDSAPEGQPSKGADLAREALAAARRRNAERREQLKQSGQRDTSRRGGAAALRRKRWSAAGPDVRDPAPLAATLQAWAKRAGSGGELTKATVFGRWPELVGADIADRCEPVSLVDGELVLQAESTAWATQLRMLSAQLISRINAEVGPGTVTRIRARGPASPSWRFGPRHVPGRGPRDTYG